MLDQILPYKDFVAVGAALVAAAVALISLLLNFFTTSSLQKQKANIDLQIQKSLNEYKRQDEAQRASLDNQKAMLLALQAFRSYVLFVLNGVKFAGIDAVEMKENLARRMGDINDRYDQVYANCGETDSELAHASKTLCLRIQNTLSGMIDANSVNSEAVAAMLADLKEQQDVMRDGIVAS